MILDSVEQKFSSQLLESLLDCDIAKARMIMDEAGKCLGAEKVFSNIIPSTLNYLGDCFRSSLSLMCSSKG
jgi:hypothetical protein